MSHAWRPVFVVLAVIVFILVARVILVPSDFSAKNGDYKYQWHRLSNEKFWKDFPVRHRGNEFCATCHPPLVEKLKAGGHQSVQCESCHAMFNPEKKSHPIDLKEVSGYLLNIGIDRSRELCKRCHAEISYRPSKYVDPKKGIVKFKMINPDTHNPSMECAMCHDVHSAGFKAAAK